MKHERAKAFGVAGFFLMTLTACNTGHEAPLASGPVDDEERFHEKSFSWSESGGPLAKPAAVKALAGKTTTFSSDEELKAAVDRLVAELEDKAFTDSLWKPVDYACDELDLALWNTYGTIRVGDSTVFDEGIMRARCQDVRVDEDPELSPLAKVANTNPPDEVVDGQYPYKMIGTSWNDFDLGIYKSAGGETQFKKRRKIWGFTGWYDLDAERIGVRVYLFDCGKNSDKKRVCWIRRSTSTSEKNDDNAAAREMAFGLYGNGTLAGFLPQPAWVPMWTPPQFYDKLNSLNAALHNSGLGFIQLSDWFGDFYSASKVWSIPIPSVGLMNLRVADGVMSLHSVNHGAMKFRATSSKGLGEINSSEKIVQLDFVTW